MNNVSPTTAGYTLAAILAIIANTLLTFAKESYPPLLAAMKAALGHHWTTHGVVIVLAFCIFGTLFSKWPLLRNGTVLAFTLTLATVISGLGLFGFFFLLG